MSQVSDDIVQGSAGPRGRLNSFVLISAALLVAYWAVTAWTYCALSTSWPHVGSWLYLVFFFLCPGILFQSFSLLYTWRTRRRLARRALTRLVTIPAGVMLAVALSNDGSARAMPHFERAYAPFIAGIGANLAAPCQPGARYFENASVANYNRRTEGTRGTRPVATLSYGDNRFVLALAGRSIDLDGSTIYYDSSAGNWRKFHNDDSEESAAYAKLTQGLAECTLSSSAGP